MAHRILIVSLSATVLVLSAACYPPAPTSACVEVGVGGTSSGNPLNPSPVTVTADCRGNSLVNQPGPVTAGGGAGGEGGAGGGGDASTNHPPDVVIEASATRVAPGETATLTASASDPDGDPVTYRWSAPAGMIRCAACRITTWTAPDDAGSYTVSVTVRDGQDGATTRSVSILVTS